MEERLKYIFTNVNDWLKFAEAKNAALVAADGAAGFAALAVLVSSEDKLKIWVSIYLYLFVFFVLCSAVVALFSIVPQTRILLAKPKEEQSETDNLLFYGDIAKYKPSEYLAALSRRYSISQTPSNLETDYAQQIIINSQIALNKYFIFRIAVWFAIAAVVNFIPALILFAVFNAKQQRTVNSVANTESIENS